MLRLARGRSYPCAGVCEGGSPGMRGAIRWRAPHCRRAVPPPRPLQTDSPVIAHAYPMVRSWRTVKMAGRMFDRGVLRSFSMSAYWLAALLIAAACGGPRSAGPIRPSPPGPFDLVRGLWGDYSGRCPDDYQYCKGERHAVCCPLASRCMEDDSGAYCARRTAHGEGGDPVAAICRPNEIACSYRGQTTCCDEDQQCCTVGGAPSCCP